MTRLGQSRVRPPVFEKGEELFHYQWNQLEEGHSVIIQRDNQPPLPGKVDVRTDDGSIFWVWLNNGHGRIAVFATEDTCVWLPKPCDKGKEPNKARK